MALAPLQIEQMWCASPWLPRSQHVVVTDAASVRAAGRSSSKRAPTRSNSLQHSKRRALGAWTPSHYVLHNLVAPAELPSTCSTVTWQLSASHHLVLLIVLLVIAWPAW